MMKHLTLIRHAKSDQGIALSDFERPLNKRGMKDAKTMGQRLRRRQFNFDALYCSPAARAHTTARRICTELTLPESTIIPKTGLYTFDMEDLYRFIEMIDDPLNRVVIIGHNPAITLLLNDLCATNIDNVPTCGIAHIELTIAEWVETHSGTGKLVDFDYPKKG